MESLIKMLESSADTDSESDDADLKSHLDSLIEEYGKHNKREMLSNKIVDIDSETGMVKVRRFMAVDDCGNIINPMIVE